MARSIMPTQHKLAEKLSILNDRASGMLIRIYNIKKMMGNPETKPHFFSEKSLDSVIKTIVKKFPALSSNNYASTINPIREEIIKSLSLYYYTFVDIMDLKDHITDLLTTIDASQVHFDITLNFDLTKNYLDLILSYFCIMILLARVEDRKAVLGLFSVAFELQNKKQEDSFPRLGQMVIDYESPLKKMAEEFIPHSKCLSQALLSLSDSFKRRTQKAEEWRSAQFLSLLADSSKIMHSVQSDVIQCEYLSLDLVEKWIAIGFLLCYQHLQTAECYELWKHSLQGGYVISLCRDEILLIHSFAAGFLDGIKGFGKKATEVKDTFHQTVSNMPLVHREKRKFLRTALKELATIFIDQPGLLGPKGLYLLMGLSLARDEFLWMLRHADNVPQKKGSIRAEDLVDRQIAELMFHMEELRGLVRKYSRVIQRYYIQYLLGYDATILNQLMQALPAFPEDESLILTSLYGSISNLSVKQVEENETFDFTNLRLDWFRLQAYSSGTKSNLSLKNNKELARHMNKIVFHAKMVDSLEELLLETSDLSIYCFYTSILEQQFKQCMEFPAQHRFSISFPMVCSHFMQTTHPLCPEERHSIGTTSIQYAHWFLKEMSEEVNQVITAICEEQCILADKLLPKNAVSMVAVNVNRKKDKKNKPEKNEVEKKPGEESRRKHREEFTRMDKLHMALTELCYSMNYCNVITVWGHGFVPREFFSQQLETRFNKSLVGMMMYSPETRDVAKPSELLNSIKAVMSVLQSIENYVHIDISKIFNSVLPQQSQPTDSCNGDATICANYTDWYLDLMKRVGQGQAIYSQNHKAFISTGLDPQCSFQIEEYADLMELRALAELIGPYGMKFLSERLMNEISKEVDDLKKYVVQNKQVLMDLRSNFDKPEVMKELQKKLTNADNVLQKMTKIGILLAFRGLAQEALLDVLEMRIPFLVSSVKDFQQHTPNGQESMIVNEMASAAGLPCDVDPALCAALRLQKPDTGEDDYTVACLLMVFIATSIPRLVRTDSSAFKVAFEGHSNNIHCLAKAINSLAGAMFTVLGHGDVEMRLKEFLALTSSSLLRLGQETEKEVIKNRESVYLLLDEIIQESPFLTMDLLESCFPYALLRTSYHHVYKNMAT